MEHLHVYDLVVGDGAFETDQNSFRTRDETKPGHAATTRPDLRNASTLT